MDIPPVANLTTCQVSTKAGQDHLTPAKGPIAAWEDTAAVAHGQGGALGGLDDPAAAADL
jgi:hypothetical protein